MNSKRLAKKWGNPYLYLIDRIVRIKKHSHDVPRIPWDEEDLRVDYQEGIKTALTGFSEEAQKVLDLRFGLTSNEPMSRRKVAKMLNMPLEYLKRLESSALWELGQEPVSYFYVAPPSDRVDDETFRKSLKFLQGSGFNAYVMYAITLAEVYDTEGLQMLVWMCPELFNIFADEGCELLVKMGCEDPRTVETLKNYFFDDFTFIGALNFSPRTHDILAYENGIATVGLLKMLGIEEITSLRGATEETVEEVCDKIVRLGRDDPRLKCDGWRLKRWGTGEGDLEDGFTSKESRLEEAALEEELAFGYADEMTE